MNTEKRPLESLAPETRALYEDISRSFGVSSISLHLMRDQRVVNIRKCVVHALRDHGFTLADIGKFLSRDHSTISCLLKKPCDKKSASYAVIDSMVSRYFEKMIMLNRT